MSVAPQFPPVVHIPESARGGGPGRPGARLRLVPALSADGWAERCADRAAGPIGDGAAPEAWLEPVIDLDAVVGDDAAPHPAARMIRSVSPRLRLTARGRLALTALALVVAGLLIALAYAGASAAASSPRGGPARVVVAPGDTLWSIAARVAPAADPRREVDALRRLNHLGGADLTPGQVLRTR